MTNSNGRNIAIVTGSALGLGYELTKQLIADGWFVAGIDTAFYRDSRDYVSEEKQHTFMDPGELARVILFNLVNDANLTVSDILIEPPAQRQCKSRFCAPVVSAILGRLVLVLVGEAGPIGHRHDERVGHEGERGDGG